MKNFFTVPNILTISRMLLLPLFVLGFFIDSQMGRIISLSIFVLCCLTDYLDGYYARAFKQTTKLGQMLDPLADKVVVSIAILCIAGFQLVSKSAMIPSAVILCREIIISGIRDASEFAGKGLKTSLLAKYKTATQMISILVILYASIFACEKAQLLGEAMLWLSATIAIISGFTYYKHNAFNVAD